MSADIACSPTQTLDSTEIRFRPSTLDDAPQIWRLVVDSGVLDANSRYCYMLLSRDFADTCVVAHRGEEIVGFVTAYCPPKRPQAVFVWQIGVAASVRGQGVGKRLLKFLLSLPACEDTRYLEATVTPSNTASRRLFQSVAKMHDVPCRVEEGFTEIMFGSEGHEPEELFRIGPLR